MKKQKTDQELSNLKVCYQNTQIKLFKIKEILINLYGNDKTKFKKVH
jgi:hypothetical protein